MTIESVVIIIVGFAATVFLLSFSWWLWTRAPVPPPRVHAPRTGPPLGPPPGAEQWMGWAQPDAQPAPPSPERQAFEQSTLVPVGDLMPNGEGELDKARTMFFFKKGPDNVPDKTQILSDALADALELETPPAPPKPAPVRPTGRPTGPQTVPPTVRPTVPPPRPRSRQPPPPPPPRK